MARYECSLLDDIDARPRESRFVAGEGFSVADITLLVTIDFPANALDEPVLAGWPVLKRW